MLTGNAAGGFKTREGKELLLQCAVKNLKHEQVVSTGVEAHGSAAAVSAQQPLSA